MDRESILYGWKLKLAMEKKILGKYCLSPHQSSDSTSQQDSSIREQKEQISSAKRLELLTQLQKESSNCQRCKLSHERKMVVFGEGHIEADLVIVGEAPGYYEDQQGRPFVGDAGQLLTKMLQAIHLQRETVYICNVIKCRPPKNRNPEAEEVIACRTWFTQQLSLLQPKLLLALGKFASQALTGITQSMWRYRGNFYEYENIPVLCSYHPAYLLRNPEDKKKAWQDLKQVRRFLDQ
jgi:DNA polymerase